MLSQSWIASRFSPYRSGTVFASHFVFQTCFDMLKLFESCPARDAVHTLGDARTKKKKTKPKQETPPHLLSGTEGAGGQPPRMGGEERAQTPAGFGFLF